MFLPGPKHRRCSLCGISYPFYGHGDKCEVCEGKLDVVAGQADDDWRDKVNMAIQAREAFIEAPDKVIDWRMHRLFQAGYDRTSAAAIAAKREIDLHQAIRLVTERGCSPELAAKILL
jgi:hypothetical protein